MADRPSFQWRKGRIPDFSSLPANNSAGHLTYTLPRGNSSSLDSRKVEKHKQKPPPSSVNKSIFFALEDEHTLGPCYSLWKCQGCSVRHSKVILLHPPCTLRDPLTDILTESSKGRTTIEGKTLEVKISGKFRKTAGN